MKRQLILVFALVAVLIAVPISTASAQQMTLDLPPGIAAQAEPLIEAMMQHMQEMPMSPQQMQMMMADMQMLADQLPPGIFLQILDLMSDLDMADMMYLHQQIRSGALLQQPPGQILVFVLELAQ